MGWTETVSILAVLLGIASTIIGLVNSKSKNDKADATEIAEIKKDLETKVGQIQFIEFSTKLDAVLKSTQKLEQDMYSVVHIGNNNSEELVKHQVKIESLEARTKKLENKIDLILKGES